jgi:magnesium transporter
MRKPRILQQNKLETKVGRKPGYLFVPDNALPTRFFLISFDETDYNEEEFGVYEDLYNYMQARPHQRHWIDIRGYKDLEALEAVSRDFNIHPLQLEDAINDYQRPKVEEENGSLFIVSRMIAFTENQLIDDDQLSIITGPNYIITFQSDYDDCLNPLRERIRAGKGIIRKKPPLYMAYAIMDVILDHYFPVLSQLSDYLDSLEDNLFKSPAKELLSKILSIKREIVKLRRIVWPERDKINEILRYSPDVVADELKIYFKDTYDHTVHIIDLIENYKETSGSLIELYLSNVSNRMNEIMKVLTVISSIFIPLSFIVGLYGMNFSRENPETGKVNVYNMPELYHPFGYLTLVAVMVCLVTAQLVFFYRKGWLSKY